MGFPSPVQAGDNIVAVFLFPQLFDQLLRVFEIRVSRICKAEQAKTDTVHFFYDHMVKPVFPGIIHAAEMINTGVIQHLQRIGIPVPVKVIAMVIGGVKHINTAFQQDIDMRRISPQGIDDILMFGLGGKYNFQVCHSHIIGAYILLYL